MQPPATSSALLAASRVGVRVRGVVQGVGFRPTVHRIATALGLGGSVANDAEGVWIELRGEPPLIARFLQRLEAERPPRARIDAIEPQALTLDGANVGAFRIVPSSAGGAARALVPADAAPCSACLAELDDPRDRRYRYPFINCTDCGPRYTLVRDVPWDRARTTMAPFTLCADCQREYEDPTSRRFHAEPNACARCGPRLIFTDGDADGDGGRAEGEAALAAAVARIAAGGIVAVKGVGGFLLAADARNEGAIAALRARKHRPHKPFALMARDLATVESVAELAPAAFAALTSPARPIVLLRRRAGATLPLSLAPGLDELGVMLPSTPLHHLLLHDGPPLQIMTSGNRGDEPIARDDAEARTVLRGIADALLGHDREIHTRADDSVVRIVAGAALPLRRARGFAPEAIHLPHEGPPLVAVGAHEKATVCLARGGEAFLSQHLGDLSSPAGARLFEETIAKLVRLLGVEPELVAHDLHPDYRSTRWAMRWAQASGRPRLAVQHHHAHLAACLAEHGRADRVIGVVFDGTGCGVDGSAWGGEWLLGDLGGFGRAGHLRALHLPGGEAAIREPWRLAVAALADAGADPALLSRIDERRRCAVLRLCADGRTPSATGAGRWFDAVSALAGVRDTVSYEGQAAVELEAACAEGAHDQYPFALEPSAPFTIDLRPTVSAIATSGETAAVIAARFHETLAHAILAGCRVTRVTSAVETVALSGGCFANRRLTERAIALLAADGFETLVHRRVPPGDGGIALGQAAVASCRSRRS